MPDGTRINPNLINKAGGQSKPPEATPVKYGKNGEMLFYVYYYYENGQKKFVYQDPDTLECYKCNAPQMVRGAKKPMRPEAKIDKSRVKKEYVRFSDLFKIKKTEYNKQLKTELYIQSLFSEMGVDPQEHIVIGSPLAECGEGKLSFANYAHAREFFKELLKDICYGPNKKRAPCLIYSYLNLINHRFFESCGRLYIDINNLIPDDDGSNYLKIEVAKTFHEAVWLIYAQLKQKYEKNIVAFPELGFRNFKRWTSPQKQREFFEFCKAHSKKRDYKNFKNNIRKPETVYDAFELDLAAKEIKMGFGIYDCLCVQIADFRTPAMSIKGIKDSIKVIGPSITDGAGLKEFFRRYNPLIKSMRVQVFTVKIDGAERVLLVKNDEKSKKALEKYIASLKLRDNLEDLFSPAHIKSKNIVEHAYEKLDKAAFPAIHNLSNAEEARAALRCLYVFFMANRTMFDFAYNPFTLWHFIASIQDFPKEIAKLGKAILCGSGQEAADAVCVILGLWYSHRWIPSLARKVPTPYGVFMNMLKKYFATEKGMRSITQMQNAARAIMGLPRLAVSAFKNAKAKTGAGAGKVKAKPAASGKGIRVVAKNLWNGAGRIIGKIVKVGGPALLIISFVTDAEPLGAATISGGIYREYRSTLLRNYSGGEYKFEQAYDFWARRDILPDEFKNRYPLLNYAQVYTAFAGLEERYGLSAAVCKDLADIYFKLHEELGCRPPNFSINELMNAYYWYKGLNDTKFKTAYPFMKLLRIYARLKTNYHNPDYIQKMGLDLEKGEGDLVLKIILGKMRDYIKLNKFREVKFERVPLD